MRTSHVYILTNKNHTVLYIGVTSNLVQRIYQHKIKFYKGFTSRYNCDQLMYYHQFLDIREAIAYEKKLKAGNRSRKEKLINEMNPGWKDLSEAICPSNSHGRVCDRTAADCHLHLRRIRNGVPH